ncbi:hypothetical protein OH76DRAFT_1411488 [Lentinus brumalis]|uniref:Uncharacterized protein n=1 Tax=Lentinus brumalis TaxID=2498619 RepID=A0A371CPC4_9APHY|nr:hypothetical protein OH76DRAFT_1411488 [Polyporus brumalis]
MAVVFSPFPLTDSIPPASLFAGDVWGVITVICSLSTNFVATMLIGYRAWKHRSLIISTMGKSSGRTQVERTLALLVESGLLYCVLWVVIVTYVAYQHRTLNLPQGYVPAATNAFLTRFAFAMSGCIIPLIGMYPTLVVILCAVDKSLYEKSTDAEISIVFNGTPSNPRGTLSELVSSAADTDEEGTGCLSSQRIPRATHQSAP